MQTLTQCDDLSKLMAVPLFANLTAQAQSALLASARRRTYSKNAIVISEGDWAQGLFIVCSGALKACLSDDQGKELVLSTMRPGDHFGELALLDGEPRSANVVALQNSQLLIIAKDAFQGLVQSDADCLWRMVLSLVKQVRQLTETTRTLALVDVFGRLVRLLTRLAQDQGGGLKMICPRPTQQDIANQIGASREMVSRILKDLVRGGILSLEPDHILIYKKFPNRW
jgi:CRP/FNR family transcriptional regulator, cyclic AMP receptor protein